MTDNKHKVAVYGSLRKAHGNNRILVDHKAEYLGTTQTKNKYAMYSLGGFPFVNLKEEVCPITVEVYLVSDKCLTNLDWLEGYRGDSGNSFYDRSEIETVDGHKAMIYHIDERTNETLVRSGDWNEYCQSRVSRTVR